MKYLKQFEAERKFEIFRNTESDEMFEYDLSEFKFDLETAQSNIGDNIYYAVDDDKMLYI